ncbi:MAG: hypothetical protein H7255_21035 [Ramlibacter sp.]|nr:hypothetical protein [Ramlibacter sp.]
MTAHFRKLITLLFLVALLAPALAQTPATRPKPAYDAALATSLGADERGMRSYVFVVLKTGPNKVPAGPERDEMFKGHFANMNRLAAEGKLAVAGPFDGKEGWRGMYVFAVKDVEEAKLLTATDPVIAKGEMVAEYHALYASAALMAVADMHHRISKR